jgi:uncharacterized membrane protein YkoI
LFRGAARLRPTTGENWHSRGDRPLLIHVSDLSAGLCQDAANRMVNRTMISPLKPLLVAVVLFTAPAVAGAEPDDHDLVRKGVERGEIRPLTEIHDAVRDKLPGKIVRTEVERIHGRLIYEFRVVDDRGRLFDVLVDAHTGEIARIKEK